MKTTKLTQKEKLVKSLELKKSNLLKKKTNLEGLHKKEVDDIKERLEILDLQLTGLSK